ncbi:MAG: dihydroorotate dehydrogenase electron transfer subunit [Gammaproteobacteria bacterium]|nr:dihydroorotate dehydrogenase electron transfer subunit [Gammaproteobacteria bacterium]
MSNSATELAEPYRQRGNHPPQRGTLHLEEARILRQEAYAEAQFIMELEAPRIAATAQPGGFVHIRCADALPLRRPLSLLDADPSTGTIKVLYKALGAGTSALSKQVPGNVLSVLGPIGNGFTPTRRQPLLIGGGVGIPPIVFLAERMHAQSNQSSLPNGASRPLVFMGSEVPFPFACEASRLDVAGLGDAAFEGGRASQAMAQLESKGIASRLASTQGYDGVFNGFVTDLARAWLSEQSPADFSEIEIFACGPEPMLRAAATLAAEHQLPAQLCLEEFMACGVGGCAGCTVLVTIDGAPQMKRVCVDGPVFDATAVYPQL